MPPLEDDYDANEHEDSSQEENERLRAQLATAQAEADRYRQRYEGEAAKTAEAERLAALREAGQLTDEEQKALHDYGEIDPKGRKAMEALEAKRAREQAALLEVNAASRASAPAPNTSFGSSMDAVMGGTGWRDTIKEGAYAEWFATQPADLRASVEAGDVSASVRAITLFEASRNTTRESDDVRRVDPRLDGARNTPSGDMRIRSSQTRSGRATSRVGEIDEDDYMAGWDYAGKDFEDDYRMLAPANSAERIDRTRERIGR